MKLKLAYVFNVLFAIALFIVPPAIAADLAKGAQVFSSNCAACHIGGGNVVNGAKTLRKADLEQYGMASLEAIQMQVKNGKAAMPAFGSRLDDEQIEAVAAYVLDQAEKGW
ncbi:cytochrome c6 PetJ [Vacuolonema iberomarrocanum]|uniref:cytochrome c6 PetJ n=1 Tax=Vacuolonema iberomarrocanum TaxID=3454632 RepID=UPI0019E25241|nr:c-type cytochrome [filamentous cyanobacterium LEGE 07170]